MLKVILSLILCGFLSKLHCQTLALDTIYNSDHSIKSILFKQDRSVTGYCVIVSFRHSLNFHLQDADRIDSVFVGLPSSGSPLKIIDVNRNELRYVRKYYASPHLIMELMGYLENSCFKITAERYYFSVNKISIARNYKYGILSSFYISEYDTLTLKPIKNLVYEQYINSTLLVKQTFHLCNSYVIINYDSSYSISEITFTDESQMWNGDDISFYNNYSLKSYLQYIHGIKTGTYLEWYASGTLKIQGEYCSPDKNKTRDDSEKKCNSWIYYWENGELEKKEFYKNGQLQIAKTIK